MTEKTTLQIRMVAPAQTAKLIADMTDDLCSRARAQGYITYAEILEAAEALVAEMMEDKKCP